MTRRRWIADEVIGNTAALVGNHAAHLTRVLRAEIGQEFDIATGAGIRLGTIVSISDARVEFALDPKHEVEAVPVPLSKLTLALAIFKFDRMEWAIEKCTEIGVSRIIPVIARRSDPHLASAAVKRQERWQRIMLQASEQSRRFGPPAISEPVELKNLIDGDLAMSTVSRVVLAESERDSRLREVLLSRKSEGEGSRSTLHLHRCPNFLVPLRCPPITSILDRWRNRTLRMILCKIIQPF